MSQTEPKRTETHYTSAEKLVQAQSISCVPVWNALDVPVFGTSRPQNPPCLTIVLHWFWGYTCSNTRMFTEHTTTFPASSTQTYAHAHTHTITGVQQLRGGTHFSCISLRSSFPAVWKDFAGACPQFVPEKFITRITVLTRHMFVDAFTRARSYAVRIHIYRHEKMFAGQRST